MKRADSEKLRNIFNKYASVEKRGDRFMTLNDFVRKYLGLYPTDDYNSETVRLLGSVVDTSKDGFISFAEFQAFEAVLCLPDALYMTAFSLFDTNGSGFVTLDEFERVRSIDWLIGLFVTNLRCDWLIDWFHWLTDWLIDWLIDYQRFLTRSNYCTRT